MDFQLYTLGAYQQDFLWEQNIIQAEAYRYALKQAKESPEVIRKAEEIKLRAERRAGELLKETPKATGNQYSANSNDTSEQKLEDMGISYDQSSKWQKIADIPEEKF